MEMIDHWRPQETPKPHKCEENAWTERASTDEFDIEITKCLICKKTLRMKTVPKGKHLLTNRGSVG